MTNSLDENLIGAGLDSHLNFRWEQVSGDGSRATFTVRPEHHQPFGIVHGGVHCALVESLASMSAAQWLQDQGLPPRVVGVNNSTDFIKAVSDGEVTGQATPIHRGRSQQLWQVDITDADGRLVAQGRVRLANLDQPGR